MTHFPAVPQSASSSHAAHGAAAAAWHVPFAKLQTSSPSQSSAEIHSTHSPEFGWQTGRAGISHEMPAQGPDAWSGTLTSGGGTSDGTHRPSMHISVRPHPSSLVHGATHRFATHNSEEAHGNSSSHSTFVVIASSGWMVSTHPNTATMQQNPRKLLPTRHLFIPKLSTLLPATLIFELSPLLEVSPLSLTGYHLAK